jgi:acyl-CoA thioester hydrolase
MYKHEQLIRVRYAETDRMGYVYYGRYAEFLEVGRVEALRALGFTYKTMEDDGVLLPVHELSIHYHQPARYDDLLTVRTMVRELPVARIVFDYEVRSENNVLLTTARVCLVFVQKTTGRPVRAPQALVTSLAAYIQ